MPTPAEDLYTVTVYFQRDYPDRTLDDFARFLRYRGVEMPPEMVAAKWEAATRHEEMRAEIREADALALVEADAAREAEHAAYVRTLPPGPGRAVVQAESEGGAAARPMPVDLLAGHVVTPAERAALSAAAVEDRPTRRRSRA